MPALPAVSDFTGADRTNAQMKVTHAALHAYLVGLFGSDGVPATALAALGALGAPGVTARTAATTLVPADRGRLINATSGSWALTLPTAATAGAGWAVLVLNSGTGTITLTRAGSDLIDGAATVALAGGMAVLVLSTGSAWVTLTLGGAGSAGRPLRATDVTTSATDATANRLLKVGDFGVGVIGNAPLLADINAIGTASGFYRTTSTGTVGTFPATANPAGHILVHRYNAPCLWQVYTPVGNAAVTAGRLWHRVYDPVTASWLPWRLIYDHASILGTVTQDAGVPTGGLFQISANANGAFERRASGWMECVRTDLSAANVSTAEGQIFRSADITWTFPSPFATGVKPVVAVTGENAALCGHSMVSISETAATFRVKAATSIASAVTIHASARGRWSLMT